MINDIQLLVKDYIEWLKDKTQIKESGEWVQITTPYLDRHNDYVQIYAKNDEAGYLLTDDSYILSDLELSGCKIDTEGKRKLLYITLNGFGVNLNGNAIEVKAAKNDFSLKKHNLIQAMLAINDLFYLARPYIKSLFLEDVAKWLNKNKVRYSPNIKFSGKSGYDHLFDFVIPKSDVFSERIIKSINNPNKEGVQSLIFAWLDTKENRPDEAKAFAVLNDTEAEVPASVVDALLNYDIKAIPWSKREKYIEELVA